jgi:hypothetical protein
MPPSPSMPREAACGSTILYPSEVQRIYVAMSAPNTTPAGWSAVGISARQVGNDASVVVFSRSIPLQIRAATTVPRLLVISNNQVVPPGACVYIDPAPSMPNLTMQVVAGDGYPVVGNATWRLSLSFLQTVGMNKVERKDLQIPAGGGYTAPNLGTNGWTVPFSSFFGGDGQIEWTYNGAAQSPFPVCIRARNPTQIELFNYMRATIPYWFVTNIALHESNLSNFCEPGRTDGAPYCLRGKNPGMPIFGVPAGYGVGQLDTPTPTVAQIWNWRENVLGMQDLTAKKASKGYAFWLEQLRQFNEWNRRHPNNQKQLPEPQVEADCTFVAHSSRTGTFGQYQVGQGNVYWFGDAIVMKQYAGARENYIFWENTEENASNPSWKFAKATYGPDGKLIDENVVREFCSCGLGKSCKYE